MTDERAITVRDNGGIPLPELGSILAKSGFFADTRDAAQAIVKVLAGQELGFGPIASMTGFYIVKGRVSMSANLMAAAVKRSGRYNYRTIKLTETVAEIAFFEGKEEIGRSVFTIEDARRAGTQNLDKFPRNMLFARAMSNGVKWYCPDVTGGPVYTPEELGEKVNEDGEIIEIRATEYQPPFESTWQPETQQPATVATIAAKATISAKQTNGAANGKRSWGSDHIKAVVSAGLAENGIAAVGALNKSTLDNTATPNDCVAWMRLYRAARDSGKTSDEAAQEANA